MGPAVVYVISMDLLGNWAFDVRGYVLTTLLCEWAVAQKWCARFLIVYNANEDRREEVQETQAKVSFAQQMKGSLWRVCGPTNLLGVVVLRYVFPWLMPHHNVLVPHWAAFLAQFVLLALFADLGLYVGHRVQHENEWLWKHSHSLHHKIRTPTAFSTAYLADLDAALQSVLPLLCSALLVRPHPLSYNAYLFFHLSNNAWNHSGLDGWWINLLSLKFLPLRCSNMLHDAHHRYSGFGRNAKNFGEMFWLWDYVFGTLSRTSETLSMRQTKNQ